MHCEIKKTSKLPRLFRDPYAIAPIFLCLAYVIFEMVYHAYAKLSVDDFWFAHAAFRFKHYLPYRDFAPYKTVLGYYFLVIPTFFSPTGFQTLLLIKNMLAILNATVLIVASFWLQRFFSSRSVLISLAILISAESVLSYSTNIRVDLIAYWFCLFALLCLLDKKFLIAGLLIGLGFTTSQKAIWYLAAGNCALIVNFLLLSRSKRDLLSILTFNIGAYGIIGIYLLFWSMIAGTHTVWTSVFGEAAAMYHLDWYHSARLLFWSLVVQFNPLLFLLAPLTLITLFVTHPADTHHRERLFAICFAATILFCLIPYQQVFPYYMQVTYPVFLILYAAFFDWLFVIFTLPNFFSIKWIGKRGLLCLLLSNGFLIIYLHLLLKLPTVYLLLTTLPLLLTLYLISPSEKNASFYLRLMAIPIVFVGFIYPFFLFGFNLSGLNGDYQRENIKTLRILTQDGSAYVAGVDFFFDQSQPIAGMKHLMGPAIDYLYVPRPKLRSVMLASLDEDPTVTVDSIITALKNSNVKVYINNYRMMSLPKKLSAYLHSHYQHFWGSIYLYSPHIKAGKQPIFLSFAGSYRIESKAKKILLNDKPYQTGVIYYFNKGNYLSQATFDYRLLLVPDPPLYLNPIFQQDHWQKMV